MKGVSFLVALSVLCNDNRVSLTLARSTLGIFIPEAEITGIEAHVKMVIFDLI